MGEGSGSQKTEDRTEGVHGEKKGFCFSRDMTQEWKGGWDLIQDLIENTILAIIGSSAKVG